MSEILKERIKLRMDDLGKNPSSVATEAGLGRSAVRDILSGKAKNPSYATLHRIAEVLDCAVPYLTGESDQIYWAEAKDILIDAPARASDVSGVLEAGVFRQLPVSLGQNRDVHTTATRERKPVRSNRRYVGRDLFLYAMGDNSLCDLMIAKGDYIFAVGDSRPPQWIELKSGIIVVAAHRPAGIAVEELSARRVIGTRLETADSDHHFPAIVLTKRTENINVYETDKDGLVTIEGVAVELTRQLDVGFIPQMY